MFLFYKNSFLASVLSILGCVLILVTIMTFEEYELYEAAIPLLLGVALNVAGKLVSNEKVFKKWWKQVKDLGYEEQIKTSFEVAQMVYSKNPRKRTLKEIAKLNPAAVAYIEAKK